MKTETKIKFIKIGLLTALFAFASVSARAQTIPGQRMAPLGYCQLSASQLAASIAVHGVMEPLLVVPHVGDVADWPDGATHLVVAGHRRLGGALGTLGPRGGSADDRLGSGFGGVRHPLERVTVKTKEYLRRKRRGRPQKVDVATAPDADEVGVFDPSRTGTIARISPFSSSTGRPGRRPCAARASSISPRRVFAAE